jgi:GntR family transcriptional regulator, rspAB operon transcriptional repressor
MLDVGIAGTGPVSPLGTALLPYLAAAPEERLPQRVYSVLRQAIRDLRLQPGQMVLEREVVDALGTSRTPVREALVRLEADDLVRLVPRHGFAVAPLAAEDMRQIYEVVEGLESVAVALAAECADQEGLAQLDGAIHQQEAALAADDLSAWVAADEAFHRLILEQSRNPRLSRLVETYNDHLHRARLYTIRLRPKPALSTAEHRAVVEAIRTRNGRAAREIHHAHRQRAREEIVGILRWVEAVGR